MSKGQKFSTIRGMNDVLHPEIAKWSYIERQAATVWERHGYREVRTPILEHTSLFVRSIGDATDVVEKEMFSFEDRDQRSLSLRPEGTAATVRAYLEHSVHQREPVTRWYYSGPMFRHERPQRGRYRQFYQLGVEALGVGEPSVDAEQIGMLYRFFEGLGLTELELQINSVGTREDRPKYLEALVAYLTPHESSLCDDCKRRLHSKPLRVLDCKQRDCKKIVADAPAITDHLNDDSRAHFDGVKEALESFAVPYTINTRLVRGLDYYTGTTYEVITKGGDLGSQNTLGAGGRYDNLVAELGGPSTPAVGFALGVERVVLTLAGGPESFVRPPEVYLATLGDDARREGLKVAGHLRARGFSVDFEHRRASLKVQMKRANKLGARTTVLIGEQELADGQIIVRDMKAGEQRTFPKADLVTELKQLLR